MRQSKSQIKFQSKFKIHIKIIILFLGLFGAGCFSKIEKTDETTSKASVSQVSGPVIEAGSIPEGKGKLLTLSNGASFYVEKQGGQLYFGVEGILTHEIYSHLASQDIQSNSRPVIISDQMARIGEKLKGIGGIAFQDYPELGYFTAELPYQPDLMDAVKVISFPRPQEFRDAPIVVMSPITYSSEIRTNFPSLNTQASSAPFRQSKDKSYAMSGLSRIHVSEFKKQSESDIGLGTNVDGSKVKVGVVDSGISLNHPTFLTQDGNSNRVTYLRDFTREGRVYFNKKAKFDVTIPKEGSEEDLTLNAQIIYTPALPAHPSGDKLVELRGLKIKVSPQLRKILVKPGSEAKLGLLQEEVFQTDSDPVDINDDGKTDSQFYMILIPGEKVRDDVVYVDPTGEADFRNSVPIGDWNKTHATWKVGSETIGFDMRDEEIFSQDSKDRVAVRSVSMVGFDPKGHGTHVAGIIAGNRIILNDVADTNARGVAPGANLLVSRVCANLTGCFAHEAIIDLAKNHRVDVINMSLGGLGPNNDGYGVEEELINRLSSVYNVLFVVSAGNSGPGRQTVTSPSTARSALSVAASATVPMIQSQYQWPGPSVGKKDVDTENSDFIFFFSSRGPTAAGGFKPNLTAPGTELSAVPLNTARGVIGGIDVKWGTSMAAPTATGAYALLLDAIRKYNLRHPTQAITTQASVLRQVLIYSARPFDVSRFDPQTGEKTQGQYTWVDQGMGMVDLMAAWKKLFEIRDQSLPPSFEFKGAPIELEFEVVNRIKTPDGTLYDGSLPSRSESSRFGNGLYLSFTDTETIRTVGVKRRLPLVLEASSYSGELKRLLKDTQDEFIFKTIYYGSDRSWLKVGTLNQTGCEDSIRSSFILRGEGAAIGYSPKDKKGNLAILDPSGINICINRNTVEHGLRPGDHGALIFGYRVLRGSDGEIQKEAVMPSFVIPVYMTVPHHVLTRSQGYEVNERVSSFGVRRNYVLVPKGATSIRVTFDVPKLKKDVPDERQNCSGIVLMPLIGTHFSKTPFENKDDSFVYNCDPMGRTQVSSIKRRSSFTVDNPTPGIWDLPVLGYFGYRQSQYRLRVDYIIAEPSVREISGGLSALNGSVELKIKESSLASVPDEGKSEVEFNGLQMETEFKVKVDSPVCVPGLNGVLRAYSKEVKEVEIATGKSVGNDIDLRLLECSKEATETSDPSCKEIGKSTGPTDEESVLFKPDVSKKYLVCVDGPDGKFGLKNDGLFTLTETQFFEPEKFETKVVALNSSYQINYSINSERQNKSKILSNQLFLNGKYTAIGNLIIRSSEKVDLSKVEIKVRKDE